MAMSCSFLLYSKVSDSVIYIYVCYIYMFYIYLYLPPGKNWCKELTHLKRSWFWERLRAGGEGDDRGWDGCMASSTWWTWVWMNSGSWWWTGRPCVLQFTGSQIVGHDWVTELNLEGIRKNLLSLDCCSFSASMVTLPLLFLFVIKSFFLL